VLFAFYSCIVHCQFTVLCNVCEWMNEWTNEWMNEWMKFVSQHIIISDKDSSPELVMEPQSAAGEITEDVRNFCDVFSLPLSEKPLPGFQLFTFIKFVTEGKHTLIHQWYIKLVFVNIARWHKLSPINCSLCASVGKPCIWRIFTAPRWQVAHEWHSVLTNILHTCYF